MPHDAAFHLGLHGLPKYPFGGGGGWSGPQRVNGEDIFFLSSPHIYGSIIGQINKKNIHKIVYSFLSIS